MNGKFFQIGINIYYKSILTVNGHLMEGIKKRGIETKSRNFALSIRKELST